MRKVGKPVADATVKILEKHATLFCEEMKKRGYASKQHVVDLLTKIVSDDRMVQESTPDFEAYLPPSHDIFDVE